MEKNSVKKTAELWLKCDCSEPFHFIYFRFYKQSGWPFVLEIGLRAFYGSFFQRLKRAVKIIFSGYEAVEPDVIYLGEKPISALRDFSCQCVNILKEDRKSESKSD